MIASLNLDPAPVAVRVGRYTMHGELAAGGMGTVHLGRVQGAAGFARTVAIKRLHAHYASEPEFVSMLIDEASTAASIHHPNVVSTLDVVFQEQELLLVMDYVEGETLARLLKYAKRDETLQPPSLPILIAILTDVLFGLHAAHSARSASGAPLQIVHRDVSPHNVLVGVDGIARVHDFGVAKAEHRRQSTRPGQIKGKFAYMAPEQIRGLPVDARTDVFAAGVVLWECLTQRRLFYAKNPQGTLTKVLSGVVPAPSVHHPGLPAELDQIVLKALSTRVDDRFATAEDFAEALASAAPRAKRSEVGQWVAETASRALAQRARLLERIDASVTAVSRITAVINGSLEVPPSPVSSAPPARRSSTRPFLPTTLRLGGSSVSISRRAAALAQTLIQRLRLRSALAMPALAAVVGLASLAAAVVFSTTRVRAAAPGVQPEPVAVTSCVAGARCAARAAPAAQAPGLPLRSSVVLPPDQAPVVALEALQSERARRNHALEPPAASLPSAGTSHERPRAGHAPPRPPSSAVQPLEARRAVSASASRNHPCDVPYYLDAAGVRRVRKECL